MSRSGNHGQNIAQGLPNAAVGNAPLIGYFANSDLAQDRFATLHMLKLIIDDCCGNLDVVLALDPFCLRVSTASALYHEG